jgi:hypothetical protein
MNQFVFGLVAGIVVGLVMEWVIDWTGLFPKRSMDNGSKPRSSRGPAVVGDSRTNVQVPNYEASSPSTTDTSGE